MNASVLSQSLSLLMLLLVLSGCATFYQKINRAYKPVDRPVQ